MYKKFETWLGKYMPLIIILTVFGVIFAVLIYNDRVFMKPYNDAWDIVMTGDYEYAYEYYLKNRDRGYNKKITTISEEERSQSFKFLGDFCNAGKYYNKGDYRRSYRFIEDWFDKEKAKKNDRYFEKVILSDDQAAYVEKMKELFERAYNDHKAEYDAEDAEARRKQEELDKQKKAEEEAKKKEAPYVGMSESKIDKTDLGVHSAYYEYFNTECINGKIYNASMYYWYSGGDCIYSARCLRGKVYNVWDNRDHHLTDNIVDYGNSSKRSSSSKSKDIDPSDYDIEAYYEDYKEDFEDEDDAWDDFEDNEEYWDDY